MDLIYGVLGYVSKRTERLSRQSANLIPMNWLILFVLAALAVGGAFKLREATANRGAARPVSVADLIDGGERYVDRHVSVAGALSKDGAFTWGRKDAKDPDAVYLPLVEADADHAVYVKASPADARALVAAGAGAVTGMVRRSDAKVRESMQSIVTVPAADGGFGRTVAVGQGVVLSANEGPANPLLWGAVTLLGGLLVLGMLLSIALRYVVFRRTPAAASGPPSLGPTPMRPMRGGPPPAPDAPEAAAAAPRDLRVSGRFTYHENPRLRRRFVNIPAAMAEMQSGDLGLVSNIDASVRFMGQVTKNRAGLWSVVIRPGTLSEIEDGLLYPGFRPRPALRFRFVDAQTGQPARAVLSFPDPESRAVARRRLVAR